jgi:hypothetical protein
VKTEFFRVRPGEEWRFQTMILELKSEREIYIVAPTVWDVVPELLRPAVLHTGIDTSNNVFLVPMSLPTQDGRRNLWHQTLQDAVNAAEKSWVRCVANMKLGAYEAYIAIGNIAEPVWPDTSLQELIQIAFRDRVIDTAEHPVIKQLLGAA